MYVSVICQLLGDMKYLSELPEEASKTEVPYLVTTTENEDSVTDYNLSLEGETHVLVLLCG